MVWVFCSKNVQVSRYRLPTTTEPSRQSPSLSDDDDIGGAQVHFTRPIRGLVSRPPRHGGDEPRLIRRSGATVPGEGQADAEAFLHCFLVDVMTHGDVVGH